MTNITNFCVIDSMILRKKKNLKYLNALDRFREHVCRFAQVSNEGGVLSTPHGILFAHRVVDHVVEMGYEGNERIVTVLISVKNKHDLPITYRFYIYRNIDIRIVSYMQNIYYKHEKNQEN